MLKNEKKNCIMKSPATARKSFLGLLLFLILLPHLAIAAEPVAMVTDVKGAARLKQNTKSTPLAILTYLAPGAEIELDTGAHVVLTYFVQSTEFTFKGPARIAIQAGDAKAISGVGEQRKLDNEKSGPVKKFIQNGKMTQAAFAMRSLPTIKPALQSPLDGKITSANPTFRWKALDDAARYQLVLTDEHGVVLHEEFVETNSWQLPSPSVLRHGSPYYWKVVAFMKSGESYSSEKRSFTIADEDAIKRIETRRPAVEASFSDRVMYAVYLETEGFREAAYDVWQELGKERPDDATLRQRGRY